MNESTLVPREELNDLDWLARNVHKWPAGDHQPWCYVYMTYGGVMKAAGSFLDAMANPTMITIEQWLSRRAELQNKPSWNDWPQWDFMAQNRNGCWITSNRELIAGEDGRWHGYGVVTSRGAGEVLGDWRDTLEKRPEKKAFQPFTSIEDNQEKGMKQDNKWFERGELPPVGASCEALIASEHQWVEIEVVCHRDGFALGWCQKERCVFYGDKPTDFRPIRTERDVLIEIIKQWDGLVQTDHVLADAILAAGFSLEAK